MVSDAFSSISMTPGRIYTCAPIKEVDDFLQARKLEYFEQTPASFRLVLDGRVLFLERKNGSVVRYPVRRAWVEKLLRWHHFPSYHVYRMDPDAIVTLLNAILKLIKGKVTVRIEDGEALTITSERYTEYPDCDVMEQSRHLGLVGADRCDLFTRLYTEERHRTEPIPGDACGFSINIFNSETGFRALEAGVYIVRFVCMNGAIALTPLQGRERQYHYGTSLDRLADWLNARIAAASSSFDRLSRCLSDATRAPALEGAVLRRRLDRILGYGGAGQFLAGYAAQDGSSLYDAFNFVTNRAKDYDINLRLQLEELAGEMLG